MYVQQDFDNVKEAVNIKDVVDQFVNLKKTGSNWQACCPFHNEKTPSFTVSESKQIFKCFGCGESGDVIKFLSLINNTSANKAMRELAEAHGVKVSDPEKIDETTILEAEEIRTLLSICDKRFRSSLLHNKTAKRYLVKRGVKSFTMLKEWHIGYAPASYEIDFAETAMIRKAGMMSKNTGKMMFRDRIVFAYTDIQGNIIGFTGRYIGPHSNAPKYINSPETPVFNKSRVLFGLRQAMATIKSKNTVIITEGPFDVISLHQVSPVLKCSVATSGTALTEDHAKILKKYCNQAVLMFDSDEAGRKAAIAATPKLLLAGFKKVQVAVLPEGQDVDDVCQEALAENKEIKLDSIDWFDFIWEGSGSEEEKVETIISMISHISSPVKRSILIRDLSSMSGLGQQFLVEQLNIHIKQNL